MFNKPPFFRFCVESRSTLRSEGIRANVLNSFFKIFSVTRHLPILTLDWLRCPDGVEVIEESWEDLKIQTGIISFGRRFRYQSENRARPLLTSNLEGPLIATNLRDPLVVRFVNAITEDRLLQFFKRFGFTQKVNEVAVEYAIEERDYLTASLKEAASGEVGLADFADLLDDILLRPAFEARSGQLALRAETLGSFMAMEVVLVRLAEARLGQCQSCGKAFLTGPMTGRRLTAEFCGDRCRQRNHRNREKEGGNVSPKAKVETRKGT